MYKINTQAGSHNHWNCEKARSITNSAYMFVALVNHHANHVPYHTIIWGLDSSTIFFYSTSPTAWFSEKVEHQTCVLIFSTNFVWNISHSKKEMNKIPYMYVGLHVKYPLIFSDFNKTWFISTDFWIILKHQNLIKILPVEAEVFHSDRHDEASSHFSQFCECAYKWGLFKSTINSHPIIRTCN
jgi:hypothetical protein